MGHSLGSAVALWLAHQVSPCKLVLMSPFDSVLEVARTRAFGRLAAAALAPNMFECMPVASEIGVRTLVLLAAGDREVPNDRTLTLCFSFGRQPEVRLLHGVTHQSLPRSELAQRAIVELLLEPS